MLLSELANPFEVKIVGGDVNVLGIELDSRKVCPGYLYIAVNGQIADGHDYINEAINNGAVAVVCEEADVFKHLKISGWFDESLKYNISALASLYYGNPSQDLFVVGITGTNGKTSIASYLMQSMQMLGQRCGQVGTLGLQLDKKILPTVNTTPDALTLHEYFKQALDNQLQFVAMEVSSHALVQGRVAHVAFNTAVFANLTHDHLDYHQSMDAYFSAKALLFKMAALESAVINVDDEYGQALTRLLSAQDYQIITYSLENDWADLYAFDVEQNTSGIKFKIKYRSMLAEVQSQLIGRFNISNLLATAAVLLANNIDWENVIRCLELVTPVQGRMQVVENSANLLALVDYAHTPDALKNVLRSCREYIQSRSEKNTDAKLITVFGCGGDRDKAKRPLMASIAEQWSDVCVVTADNPRTESQDFIFNDIAKGFVKNDFVRVDGRAAAIQFAVEQAHSGDVILVAGKGHEEYQLLDGQQRYFSDVECLSSLFRTEAIND